MDEFTLREEILLGETDKLQFKRQLPPVQDLAKEIVAFLNTRGGKLFIGVNDDGSIRGIPAADHGQPFDNGISNTCNDNINPPCEVTIHNVNTGEGLVVVIEVPEGPTKPYQANGKDFYVKRGPDRRAVKNLSELRRLFAAGTNDHSDLHAVPGTGMADLDLDSLRSYYTTRFPGEELAEEEAEISRQLQGVRLMSGASLTVVGTLLFAKRPSILLPSFVIKAIWFKGIDQGGSEYYDNRRFEGTLQSQYDQALAFFSRWNSRVQDGGSFNGAGMSQIPELVFEELVVNALVHRDYAISDSIKLFIFDDRIEIRSPGTLPNSLTEEEALKGIGRDRNSQLESFAYDLMKYRGARSGLLRARKLIPEITLHNDVEGEEVTVIIPL